jgi:putative ABC transport system permease protein
MLTNILKIALRNFFKSKLFSAINIIGLSISLACVTLILIYVNDELSYDKHNSKYKQIYRVILHLRMQGNDIPPEAVTPFAWGPALKDEYSIVKESVRFYHLKGALLKSMNGEVFREDNIYFADPSVFTAFDHKFIYGDPKGALDVPNTIVLSESLAKKYFGKENPVGKTISRIEGNDFTVTGVFEDLPANTHMRYEALAPLVPMSESIGAELINSKEPLAFLTDYGESYVYLLLVEKADISIIKNDFNNFIKKYVASGFQNRRLEIKPEFQRLDNIHHHSNFGRDFPTGNINNIYIFLSVAIFILIIASINYVNLAVARSINRAKEIGIRKVLGANRASLIWQFLGESMILTTVSMFIAIILIELFLPIFNNLIDREFSFSMIANSSVIVSILLISLAVGLLSGSYPAFFLSSLLPVNVLKGNSQSVMGSSILRKTSVIIQFSLSVIMIICTFLVIKQIHYIRDADLGFNQKNVLIISPLNHEDLDPSGVLKEELLKNSEIKAVARTFATPGQYLGTGVSFLVENAKGVLEGMHLDFLMVDFDFVDLMGMQIVKGRSFNREMVTDEKEAFLINQTAVKKLGWTDDPIGKHIIGGFDERKDGKVIGVLKDSHFGSFHEPVRPLVVFLKALDPKSQLCIRISPNNPGRTIDFIRKKWMQMYPDRPFLYSFMEDDINNLYQSEKKLSQVFIIFTFLCFFISCLGMLGLSSFFVEKRTKEIGIRKVLGASAANITFLLSWKFLKMVLISNLFAWPIAYYIMSKWFESFAYRTNIDLWRFIIATTLSIVIALIVISFQAIKAALSDPVKTLKYE